MYSLKISQSTTCHFPITFRVIYTLLIITNPKYLSSETLFICLSSTIMLHTDLSSPPSTLTLLLSLFLFSPLYVHTSATRSVSIPRYSSNSPHNKGSYENKKAGNLQYLLSTENITPVLPIPIFTFFFFIKLFQSKN